MPNSLSKKSIWNFLDNLNEGIIILYSNGKVEYLNSTIKAWLKISSTPKNIHEILQVSTEQWEPLLSPPTETYFQLPALNLHLQSKPVHKPHHQYHHELMNFSIDNPDRTLP